MKKHMVKSKPNSIYFIIFFILIVGIFIIFYATNNKQNIIINNYSSATPIEDDREEDPLLNPYAPPLRNERYNYSASKGVTTNIGAVNANYRQIGIMTATNAKGKIIPLMGRPLFVNRNKWQYYSMSTEANHVSIKLPLSRNGKSCTSEYGCDKLYNGDTVYVEGLNEPYNVTVYDNDTMKYIP